MNLDLDKIQGNIVPGFSKDHQAFVFVRFRDREGSRKWLAALQPEIASAHDVQGFKLAVKSMLDRRTHLTEPDGGSLSHISSTWVNVAISFAGLRLLPGVGNLGRFAQAFKTDRVPGADAQSVSGDVHGLLIVAADLTTNLDGELDRQKERMAAFGVDEVAVYRGDTLPGDQRGREHFGFKDAVSQPQIAGTAWGTPPAVASGEFILGYPDQTGASSGADLPAWTRNGSFLAFLQLQQHVATFWSAMRQHAQQFGVQPEEVAEWIVGRTHDARGTPLANPPARQSHIGRAYSRWLPPAEVARHRLIRRGIPYGSRWQEGQPDDDQRGLLFVTYQADIERQFQFVWTQWLGQVAFPLPATGTDALVGQIDWPGCAVPSASPNSPAPWNPRAKRPASARRAGQTGGTVSLSLPAFVTPRFGGYFFAPGIDALSQIAGRAAPNAKLAGDPDGPSKALWTSHNA